MTAGIVPARSTQSRLHAQRGLHLLQSNRGRFLPQRDRRPVAQADFGADSPHVFIASVIYEFPFDRGRKWGARWHPAIDAVLGGWQVSGVYTKQTGLPITLPNAAYFGDLRLLRADHNGGTVTRTVFDRSGFYFTDAAVQTNGVVDSVKQRNDTRIRLANNVRTMPQALPWFRTQGVNQLDASALKNFRFTERVKLQLRAEVFNVLNYTPFCAGRDGSQLRENHHCGQRRSTDNAAWAAAGLLSAGALIVVWTHRRSVENFDRLAKRRAAVVAQ